jgi:hypothetical protein
MPKSEDLDTCSSCGVLLTEEHYYGCPIRKNELKEKPISNPADKNFQTRSEETGSNYFDSLKDALEYAEKNESVWKISFSVGKERVRLERTTADEWIYSPIM